MIKTSHGLFPFYKNDQMGFFDKSLQVVIPPQYSDGTTWALDTPFGDHSTCFSDGLALVRRADKRFAFVSPEGRELVDDRWSLSYHTPRAFREGLAAVCIGMKWGFINTEGELVIAPQFDNVEPFSNGLARISDDDHFLGFINTHGEWVIGPEFICGSSFSEGMTSAQSTGKEGVIDTSGRWVIDPKFDYIGQFSEGMAVFYVKDAAGDKLYGYINTVGEVIIEPQFKHALPFCEGLAQVKVASNEPYRDKSGFINSRGSMVIEPRFGDTKPFSEGRAPVFEEPNSIKYMPHDFGIIDGNGQYIILPGGSPRIAFVHPFQHGLARIHLHDLHPKRDRDAHYIDLSGKLVWSSEN